MPPPRSPVNPFDSCGGRTHLAFVLKEAPKEVIAALVAQSDAKAVRQVEATK